MEDRRVFLGWDGPCLPRAAAWLRARYGRENTLDLSNVIVATSANRAGRRLLELLADAPPGVASVLVPPAIVTIGHLPELLYESPGPVADDLQAALVRVHALRQAPRELVARFIVDPPEADDWQGWLLVAEDLAGLDADLAGQGVTFDTVADRAEAGLPDFIERPRWDALATLQEAYQNLLADMGLTDVHRARAAALALGQVRTQRDIVLLATLEISGTLRQMLEQVATQVTPLIHAPAQKAANFGPLGDALVEPWANHCVNIPREGIRVVDRPRDQAFQVLRELERLTLADGTLTPDQVTVGLGDEALAPMLERMLDLQGIASRSAAGRPIGQSRPVMFLAAAGRFLASERLDDLAALLRHPDLAGWLHQHQEAAAIDDWLSLLDNYISDHLQGRLAGQWLGRDSTRRNMNAVYDAVWHLAPDDHARPKPLPDWAESIALMLEKIYGQSSLQRDDADDAQLIRALTVITDALRAQRRLDPQAPTTPRLSLSQAITLTLAQLAQQALPSQAGDAAIEMLGWLELQLDDAPVLLVTGVNEGAVPQSRNADAFLPDRMRSVLGLPDNISRLARDKAMLAAMLESRPEVVFVSGRRDGDGNPLIPSRLLLDCPSDELTRRVMEYYGRESEHSQSPPLLTSGRDTFAIPMPRTPNPPITKLRVTAFADYLACPYRFYLKHVLKLGSTDDRAVELDALRYGTLAHEIMRRFGNGLLAQSHDEGAVINELTRLLDECVLESLGDEPCTAAMIQCEQLRQRLTVLGRWQAKQVAEGWRIAPTHIEQELHATIDVDGSPFTITGRIDRIDHHPQQGCYRILDYKSGDTAATPDHHHRTGPKTQRRWVDLQLPLYTLLARAAGLQGELRLGYVQLPKDPAKIGLAAAEWTAEELDEAVEEARKVIRHLRAGVFWPPALPLRDDEFSAICMDAVLDRQKRIERAGALTLAGVADGGTGGDA